MPSYSFNCLSNPFNFPHPCSTKLLILIKWVWYPIERGTLHLRLRVTRRCRRKVPRSMWKELLEDADAKFLAQCERSYSQTQTQSYSLSVNRVTRRRRHKVTRSMWTDPKRWIFSEVSFQDFRFSITSFLLHCSRIMVEYDRKQKTSSKLYRNWDIRFIFEIALKLV